MEETKVSLKLLVDTKANKVLFAEAGKDFHDFLFQIMSLCERTAPKPDEKYSTVGVLGTLYKSIESLSSYYPRCNLEKKNILKPTATVNVPLLDLNEGQQYKKIKSCRSCGYVTPINTVGTATTSSSTGGYVKEVETYYMVMDNLNEVSISNISMITLMNKFNVKDVSALTEKNVQVGLAEGLAMLKASFDAPETANYRLPREEVINRS